MIHLEYTGKCDNCECAELELECMGYQSDFKEYKHWAVKCIHEDACNRMIDMDREMPKWE